MLPNNRIRWSGLAVVMLVGCGGGSNDGDTDPPDPPDPPVVTVTPSRDTLTVGTSVQLTATVTGNSNSAVSWSVSGGGAVSSAGLYTAGATPATAQVIATSAADASSKDSAVIVVVGAPSGTLTVSDSATQGSTLHATLPAGDGLRYAWVVTGGTIAAGQGTRDVTVTAGGGGLVSYTCRVSNLADSVIVVAGQTVLMASPVITSFTATRPTVTVTQHSSLVPVFANGTGSIDHGLGAVTSGSSVDAGSQDLNYAGNPYTLTVTGFRGATSTATVRILAVFPPDIELLETASSRFPLGGIADLVFKWDRDSGVVARLDPGTWVTTTDYAFSDPLPATGSRLITASVTTPADSVGRDTITIQVVTPASGSIARAGDMVTGRAGASATPLANGKVMITGGSSQFAILSSAEIFDPATRTFAVAASLHHARQGHSSVLLNDGRVVVAGSGTDSLPIEIYDPATNSWTDGPYPTLRIAGAATLTDGRVLLVSYRTTAAQVYDPATDSLHAAGVLAAAVDRAAIIPLSNNRVLITGGQDLSVDPTRTAQIFDGSTNQFALTGQMISAHGDGTITRLQDGRVIAIGGIAEDGSVVPISEIFDPISGTWSQSGTLATPRRFHHAGLLSDGRVVVFAGTANFGSAARYAETWNPGTGTFTPTLITTGDLPSSFSSLAMPNGQVLTYGGLFGFSTVSRADVIIP